MSVKIIKKGEAEFGIEGIINMQTVPDASKQLHKLISEKASEDNLTIDLALVSRSDSGGVAMLIDAMQFAEAAKLTLMFSHLPQQMRDIADISGLLEVLPISENQ